MGGLGILPLLLELSQFNISYVPSPLASVS